MPATRPIDRGLNVAFLTHRLSREGGGLQSAMHGLSRALNLQGHTTSAIGITDQSLSADQQNWGATALHANKLVGPTVFGYSPNMRTSLESIAPDVVHQHGLWTYASIAGQRYCAKHQCARIISPHNMLDHVSMGIGSGRKKVALSLYEKRNLDTAGVVHALVEREGLDIRASGFKAPRCVIPNGIEVAPGGELPTHLAKLVDGSPYLLYLSRLTDVKQVLTLIQAWQQCTKGNSTKQWKLIVAGWGTDTMRQRVEAAVAQANHPSLHFVGAVYDQDKDALFANARAFALPSSSEGLPMAVLESLAHGTPTMITELCNLPDVAPAGAGIVVEPQRDSIANGINTLIEMNDAELESMRANAKALVRKSYTWEVAAAQFTDVYDWLAGGGERPNSVRWID